MKIENLIKLPISTDSMGIYIYDADKSVIFQTRGFGKFKAMTGSGQAARELQKKMADRLVDLVNGRPYSGEELRRDMKEFGVKHGIPKVYVDRIIDEFVKKIRR